jgi:hypothetical protein
MASLLTARASILLERPGHDREVGAAEPLVDDLLPFVGQAGERRERVVAGRL